MLSLTRPINAQLEITDKCNFRCRHCYHLDFECARHSNDLSDEKVMIMAKKLAAAGIFSMVITGGEPLIRKDLTKKLVKYFKSFGMDVSLNTNLQLLDLDTLEYFIASRLDGMLISCPSADPEIYSFMTGGGSFTRFSDKLKLVIEHKQHCAVNMVVNNRNFNDIRKTAIRMHDLGVEIFGATPMGLNPDNPDLDNLLTREQIVSLAEELFWIKDNLKMKIDIFEAVPKCVFPEWLRAKNPSFMNRKCQAGKTIVSVSNNGDIRPCSHNPAVYGNIFQESLEKIWKNMEEWRTDKTVPTKCVSCKLVANCYGGCRITAKACTGDCKGEDPWMGLPILTTKKSSCSNSDIVLEKEMIIIFSKIFRWRKENSEDYLISSTRSNRNVTMINTEMYNFVYHLRKLSPLTIGDLADTINCDFNDQEFQRVIKILKSKGFISLEPGRKE